ncbi:uncharacterized protein An08g09540 [Aspergillus niger]|uniref:Contig An08c0230, genomic contig n=2 Tax=Aspergillus niger TaxID=5061 RepID=A5AB98_ASPNC|nr:uncharacterized protein An08g09540 [Aspergillus niger]CAK96732.1 unnamed protein product [Aspergillus niger]
MIQQRHNRIAVINFSQKRKASPSEELSDYARARARPPSKTHIQKNIDIVKPASMTPTTEKQEMNEEGQEPPPMNAPRDPNISDEVWDQLQLDKAAARFHQEGINSLHKITARLRSEATKYESVIRQADSDSQESECQQKLTKVRQLLEKFQESLAEKEKAAQEERDIQERLKELGNCPFGYEWIRQRDGYRVWKVVILIRLAVSGIWHSGAADLGNLIGTVMRLKKDFQSTSYTVQISGAVMFADPDQGEVNAFTEKQLGVFKPIPTWCLTQLFTGRPGHSIHPTGMTKAIKLSLQRGNVGERPRIPLGDPHTGPKGLSSSYSHLMILTLNVEVMFAWVSGRIAGFGEVSLG